MRLTSLILALALAACQAAPQGPAAPAAVAADAILDLPKKMPLVAGGFVTAEGNCRIWLPWAPPISRPPYAARWPGACPDGLAEGGGRATIEVGGAPLTLDGTFRAGRPVGMTRFSRAASAGVAGFDIEFSFGEQAAEGPAIVHNEFGEMRLEMRAGRPVALLGQTQQGGGRFDGRIPLDGVGAGQGTITSKDGTRYTGALLVLVPHGEGTWTFADGARFSGEHRNGKREGRGVQTSPDGRRIEGNWKDNAMHGRVRVFAADGTLTSDQEWVKGIQEGNGWAMLPDRKARYDGHWWNRLPDGAGALIREDGSRAEGTWRQGCLVGAKPPVAAFTDVVHCGN